MLLVGRGTSRERGMDWRAHHAHHAHPTSKKRNKLTRVVSTADSCVRTELVHDFDVDLGGTSHAKLGGQTGVGEMKLAIPALNATNGLASSTLGVGPLRLLVTSRAGVGAERAFGTAVAVDAERLGHGHDAVVASGFVLGRRLNTNPAIQTVPWNGDGTVLRGELGAIKLAIGEVGVQASGA